MLSPFPRLWHNRRMFKFEHHQDKLLSPILFIQRVLLFAALAGGILLITLVIGVIGYRILESLPWLDALLNAAMLLSGRGASVPIVTPGGKLFTALYALFSGVVFLGALGILVTPIAHRILHMFYLGTAVNLTHKTAPTATAVQPNEHETQAETTGEPAANDKAEQNSPPTNTPTH